MKTATTLPEFDSSPRPTWRFPWLVLVGVMLLVCSVVGANQALNNGNSSGSYSAQPAGPQTEAERAKLRSVCFGFVDTEEGVVNLYPAQPGRVKEVFFKEGDLVESGTVLFTMDDRLAQTNLKGAQEDLEAAELKVEKAKAEVQKHLKTLQALDKAIRAKEVELLGGRAQLARLQRVVSKGLAAPEEQTVAEKKIESLELEIESKREELEAARLIDTNKLILLAEKEVAGKQIQLEKAKLGVSECSIVAPDRGRVMRSFIRPGEPLGSNPRLPAAQFIAEKPRIVRAEITQDYAARLHTNQTALIQDDSRKGATWNGRVIRVSDWYSHRRSMLQEPLQFNDVRTVEVIVEFTDTPPPPVKVGQRMLVILHE